MDVCNLVIKQCNLYSIPLTQRNMFEELTILTLAAHFWELPVFVASNVPGKGIRNYKGF